MGYAVEDGEYKIGLRSVSAPVTDSSGDLRYALSTVGFFRKTSSEEFKNAVDATIKQADMLSNALRYD
jgi:IclR family acetate operon transcriptional repressor